MPRPRNFHENNEGFTLGRNVFYNYYFGAGVCVCVCVCVYIYIIFFLYKMLFQPKAFLMIHRRDIFFKCRPLLVFVERKRERKRRNTGFHSNTKGTSKLLYRSIVALQSKQHKCCKLILYYMHVITWHTKMQHWVLYSMYQRISAVFIQ